MMIEDMPHTVTDFTCDGKCSNCGNCCTDILPISASEIARIKAYMRKHPIQEQRHSVLQVGIDLTCPFRDEKNKKCLIYEVRPAVCRSFICNMSPQEIQTNKKKYHAINSPVFMRTEFFGNTEDSDWYFAAMRIIMERRERC